MFMMTHDYFETVLLSRLKPLLLPEMEEKTSQRTCDGSPGKGCEDDAENVSEATRIVLVGKSGVGKSAVGNSILGTGEPFLSKASLKSVTKSCDRETRCRGGRLVSVVDTPGFFDTKLSNPETLREVSKCVVLSAPGPHAILVVIQAGRFTKEEEDTIAIIQDLFGARAAKYIVVLFTRREDLGDQTVKKFVDEADRKLKKLLAACGGRYCFFNNRARGEAQERQVHELLEIVDKMVEENGGTCYTTEAFQMAQQILKEKAEKLWKKYDQEKEEKLKKIRLNYEKEMHRIGKGTAEEKENRKEIFTEEYKIKVKETEHYYAELMKGAREEAEHDVLHSLKKASVGALVGGAVGTCVGLVGGPVGVAVGVTVGAAVGGALGSVITQHSVTAFFSNILKEQTTSPQ
ncbi:hypothetical protein NDU88_000129 [Pleurodeles waltl]|uniref:AIG1-type G domain-containing protein n=1 Tax=Pleurodeles waltl TaxID=8319 RepID=A0AAV7SW20_PLEWA|nr:hypothetical protein NDU88_000129 [Pleurodeles waltl]